MVFSNFEKKISLKIFEFVGIFDFQSYLEIKNLDKKLNYVIGNTQKLNKTCQEKNKFYQLILKFCL